MEVSAGDWDALNTTGNPFFRHAFLSALEEAGCVGPTTGWRPQHLLLYEGARLAAAMPLYLKFHSFGEFVFDWAWAEAYARAGLAYYPKLVNAVPFTPATGPRLLAADARAASQMRRAALAAARKWGVSSMHCLFPTHQEAATWQGLGLLLRRDCQFHWRNRAYRDFDDFLDGFTAKRRKEVRRERRRATACGLHIEWLQGADIRSRHWNQMYEFYVRHTSNKGGQAYLTRGFFHRLGETMNDATLLLFASRHGRAVAGAMFIEGGNALYGRYWGASEAISCLHFEMCFYRPIDYCISHGLGRFEAGAQGEHKLGRGLAPAATYSVHWLADARFHQAIGAYLKREAERVNEYERVLQRHAPYRRLRREA